MTPSAQLVIGCSEQLPNDLRAYRLLGTSSEGAVLLSRHGATYSAAPGEVSDYGQLLERMLGSVLENLPLDFRPRARVALTTRWNRDWGVEAEDLIQAEAGGDRPGADASANGSASATDSVETSSSPLAPSQPKVDDMDPSSRKPPSPAVSDPDGGQSRERARRRRHID